MVLERRDTFSAAHCDGLNKHQGSLSLLLCSSPKLRCSSRLLRPPVTYDWPAHALPHPPLHAHSMSAPQSVSTFGKKKTATAVAHAKEGKGLIRVNGQPISLVEPQILRWKVYEPVLVVGEDKFS